MKQNMSNEELFVLQRMIEGDENAFKYFFDVYFDDLCNFVNSYIRDEIISEDIVQSIFIHLWEKKDSLPYNCSIKSYLYSASKNKSLNQLRNIKNRNRIAGELFTQPESISDDYADHFLEFEELKAIISNAIEGLPTQCKSIFQLSRDERLTNKEIADRLGITIKTVENQITIAIRKIKDFLRPFYDQIFILFILANYF